MTRSTSQRLLAILVVVITAGRLAAQSPTKPPYIGVSSCTAAACHGSPQQAARPAWQSAYTVWTTQDPHASAYTTLFKDRSRRMVQILHGDMPSTEQYRQVLHDRCIGCHATPDAPAAALVDGVSCEACHGPAGSWLKPHTRANWPTLAASEKESLYGQTNTLDLAARADVCVRCHVGPGAVEGQLYDVNHDLVAAGHPRLTFEFSAYLAHMPAHWDTVRDRTWADKTRKTRRADYDVESWIAGQFASGQAALHLRGTRANQFRDAGNASAIWPEFAEYDCTACHHALRPQDTARQEPGSKGRFVSGTWNYFPIVSALQFDRNLATLEDSDAKAASIRATLGFVELIDLQRETAANPPGASTILARMSAGWRDWNWDQAAQWYLAAAALSGSYAETGAKDSLLRANLRAFRDCLERPLPTAELILDPSEARQSQAYQFDPKNSQFRKALEDLLEQLK